jgi:hypothetical protein
MKSPKVTLLALIFMAGQLTYGQQTDLAWAKWSHLIGEWVGEGNGKPGQGEGKFTLEPALGGSILERKNHTVFPATATKPEAVHDDLLIVYQQGGNEQQEAIYFDNEGNVIKYKVTFEEGKVIMTSEISDKSPRFRFTYSTIDSQTINILFEMASPQSPEDFKTYLSGKAFRTK